MFFHGGRIQADREIFWTSNRNGVFVDENQTLSTTEPGNLVLTASLADRPEITATVSATIKPDLTSPEYYAPKPSIVLLFPNPASNFVRISGVREASGSLYDTTGKCYLIFDSYEALHGIDITDLPSGIYVVHIESGEESDHLKFMKE